MQTGRNCRKLKGKSMLKPLLADKLEIFHATFTPQGKHSFSPSLSLYIFLRFADCFRRQMSQLSVSCVFTFVEKEKMQIRFKDKSVAHYSSSLPASSFPPSYCFCYCNRSGRKIRSSNNSSRNRKCHGNLSTCGICIMMKNGT